MLGLNRVVLIAGWLLGMTLAATVLADSPRQASPKTETKVPSEARVTGSFDLGTVEDLALYYAEESIRRLPISLPLRLVMLAYKEPGKKAKIEEMRSDPPKADERGAVYPFGDANPLSFVFDAETRTLTVSERLTKYRGKMSSWGLTAPEMAAALNASTSPGRRAGGQFAHDPVSDAMSLRRQYSDPPQDRESFYQDVDRLLKARTWWFKRNRFIEARDSISATHRPPDSATASSDGFEASLVLRHFSAEPGESAPWVRRYVLGWGRSATARPPWLVSDRSVLVDQTLHAFLFFRGASNDAGGTARVHADFTLKGPGGVLATYRAILWQDEAPPGTRLELGEQKMSPILTRGSPLGPHSIEATVCDRVTDRCVRLEHRFELIDR